MSDKVTAYKCSWCGGHLRRKRASVDSHEGRCFTNPSRKACKTCVYLDRQFVEDSYTDFGVSGHMENFCEKEIEIADKLKFNCQKWGNIDRSFRAEKL